MSCEHEINGLGTCDLEKYPTCMGNACPDFLPKFDEVRLEMFKRRYYWIYRRLINIMDEHPEFDNSRDDIEGFDFEEGNISIQIGGTYMGDYNQDYITIPEDWLLLPLKKIKVVLKEQKEAKEAEKVKQEEERKKKEEEEEIKLYEKLKEKFENEKAIK